METKLLAMLAKWSTARHHAQLDPAAESSPRTLKSARWTPWNNTTDCSTSSGPDSNRPLRWTNC